MLEETQPHVPKHRRDGVPLDGAPDLGVFASGLRDAPTGAIDTPLPLLDRETADPDLSEFGENPDIELAG